MKLNKFISKYQTSSKKKAEQYISQGKVKVNKSIVTDIFFEVDKEDKVLLNNKLVNIKIDGYILYNKPKDVDLNHLPEYVINFLKNFYSNNDYKSLNIGKGMSGLVLFYDDINFNFEKRKKFISVLFDIQFDSELSKDQKDDISKFVNTLDELSEINFIKNNNAAIRIMINNEGLLFKELNNYGCDSIDRVLISNLDKFEVPRGKFRELNKIEILNFKSLSTSPIKTSG
ncbi:MAG: S4 domain-containing protein [Flavobacteriaceae bacterium]